MKHSLWPKILVVMAVMLAMVMIPATTTAIDPDGALTLDNKDPITWARISDTRIGALSFYSSGATFAFGFVATGLEPSMAYSLIYYADPWPGNNPGKLISDNISDGSGGLTISGSVELNMSLPTLPDSNMTVSHAGTPDYYTPAYGAKIWLVPSDCYDAATSRIKDAGWQPTRFLFETALITYTDTDLPPNNPQDVPIVTTIIQPAATIGLTVSPPSLGFGNVNVNTCSVEQVITLTNAGNTPIKVTASTSAGFYTDCLKINDLTANGWVSATIPVGSHLDINVKVCPTIAYSGTITGSVSFVASFAP